MIVARCDVFPSERKGISVFVVDDEEMIARSLTHILRKEGFVVSAFTNPLKALRQMRTTAPDLLISDVMMPELSGLELARRAQALVSECKVLLISAAAEELIRDAGDRGVGFRLLSKPLHPSALLEEIAALTAHLPRKSAAEASRPCIVSGSCI
jgi:DNA-binding response OmpR family regulator